MPATDLISNLRRQFASAGPRRTLLHLFRQLRDRAFPPKPPIDPFDLRYGVDTSGLIDGRRLASGHVHDLHVHPYWATPPSLLAGALARWSESLANTPYSASDYTLIDIGCGKGRVVMLASDYPFRRVVGVELSPALAAIAQQNLVKWKQSPHLSNDLVVLHADALEVPFPATPVLVYVFNPFDAHVTQLLLDRLQTLSLTRTTPIDFIYTRPEFAELFKLYPQMRLLWEGDVPFSAEDAAADVFHGKAQGCCIYRLAASLVY